MHLRESAFLGTPAVNIGTRQKGRDRSGNVVDTKHDKKLVIDAVKHQISHGSYPSDHLYGDGNAGLRIAEKLATLVLNIQKHIGY